MAKRLTGCLASDDVNADGDDEPRQTTESESAVVTVVVVSRETSVVGPQSSVVRGL